MSLRLAFYTSELSELLTTLELLARAGVRAQLCLSPPTSLPADLEALGLWADSPAALPPLRPSLIHALASPRTLGAILEHATEQLGSPRAVPILFGAPALGHFVAFRGLHHQLYREALWAIARQEPDLAVALHEQTPRFSLYDLSCLYLETGMDAVRARLRTIQADPEPSVVFMDSLTERHTALLGTLLWEQKPPLVAGSVAVEHTLLAGWRAAKLLPEHVTTPHSEPARQLLVVSGVDLRELDPQLTWARTQGFFCHTFREAARAVKVLQGALSVGHSGILYAGSPAPIPEELAHALRGILEQQSTARLVVYGQELLRAIATELAVEGLEWVAALEPGAPLCRLIGGPFAGKEVVVSATPPADPAFLGRLRQSPRA
ncbi:hypothetical protein [Armatimonas rosea]|uniref:Uncharacterized protein YgbK (DUF1537 family) n=1 Tax=Armatimonas rosea TaxID=685828 RepID=A0A7W9SPX9_ARMRO|nr:hypothetical protein [Armatimonas rosea]MBB6049873.1 uncharacterized protein YgbK (DUF1537 family) [Armatimonas rosea]